MSRRALSSFVFINIVISLGMVFLAMYLWDNVLNSEEAADEPVIPEARTVIITSTPVPGELPAAAYEGTISALEDQVAEGGATRAPVPTSNSREATPTLDPDLEDLGVPTLRPEFLTVTLPGNPAPNVPDVSTSPNDGCERYTVVQGDTCIAIANKLGVDLQDLLDINGLTDSCLLNIGDELRIPGPGCAPPPTQTPIPTATNTPFAIGTFSITNTPLPTATNATVRITNVANFGDPTSEQVEIENFGEDVVNLLDWTLEDADGNTYTFPDNLMQPGQRIRIFTRQGNDTPAALFWGEINAVWSLGEAATLSDASGQAQSVFSVGGEEIDFDD
jgi:LysM repeat protein